MVYINYEMNLPLGLAIVLVHTLVAALWLHKAVSRIPPGVLRVIVVLPTLAANCVAPFMFDTRVMNQKGPLSGGVMKITLSFVVMWLTNCKVLAFCLNRGVLAEKQAWIFWKFLGLYLFPVLPKKPDKDMGRLGEYELDPPSLARKEKVLEALRLFLQFYFKLAMLVLFAYIIAAWDPATVWKSPLYCYGLMYLLGSGFDMSQAIALLLFNIQTIDSFNHPYIADCLVDLWGTRWNIMTAAYLRPLSYDLLLDGKLVLPEKEREGKRQRKPEWIRALATITIFIVSGLFHLLVFWYMTSLWEWQWLLFFFVFGPLMIVERAIKGFLEGCSWTKKVTVPEVIRIVFGILYSNGGTLVLASFLFVPPIDRGGIHIGAGDWFYLLIGKYTAERDI